MCYSDIDNKLSVNKKLSRIAGPVVAVYWSLLQEIMIQVKKKNKFDPDTGYFRLDRKFVFSETGIETEEQKNCDQILFKLKIITGVDPSNSDRIKVDVKHYYELLTDDTLIPEDMLPKSVKETKVRKQMTKEEGIKAGILNLFDESDETLLEAYRDLIDVQYHFGICKHAQWKLIISMINDAAKTDADKLSLVKFAITTGWRSWTNIVEGWKRQSKPANGRINKPQTVCTSIDDTCKY